MLVYSIDEPFVLVHSLNWRKNGKAMVMTMRHDRVSIEPFLGTDPNQWWYVGRNGELMNKSSSEYTKYLNQKEGCMDLDISTKPITMWVLDAMGEHSRKYRVVPRQCPQKALRCTLGSFTVGLENVAVEDDSNGWYFLTLNEMLEKKAAHVRPLS
ncbi:MAG: hypothetical protein ACO35C_05235 [Pontimonas sp.]